MLLVVLSPSCVMLKVFWKRTQTILHHYSQYCWTSWGPRGPTLSFARFSPLQSAIDAMSLLWPRCIAYRCCATSVVVESPLTCSWLKLQRHYPLNAHTKGVLDISLEFVSRSMMIFSLMRSDYVLARMYSLILTRRQTHLRPLMRPKG